MIQDIAAITTQIRTEFPELSKKMPAEAAEAEMEGMSADELETRYTSLVDAVDNYSAMRVGTMNTDGQDLPGYPIYPPSEDIYNREQHTEIDPEDLLTKKTPDMMEGELNEKDFDDDMTGGDLDVPGAELDDEQESVGSEDEENNYYSLGGDNHNDLEEDKG